jgi:hypothetical protein
MIRYLILACLATLPLAAQGSSQCTLFPDLTVYAEPQGQSLCTPHAVLTNASDVWADVTLLFRDTRHGGSVGLAYMIAPHSKRKINLQEGFAHSTIMNGTTRPANEKWFIDTYFTVTATGGDVRTVLEQSRGGVPVREYGQRCEPIR